MANLNVPVNVDDFAVALAQADAKEIVAFFDKVASELRTDGITGFTNRVSLKDFSISPLTALLFRELLNAYGRRAA